MLLSLQRDWGISCFSCGLIAETLGSRDSDCIWTHSFCSSLHIGFTFLRFLFLGADWLSPFGGKRGNQQILSFKFYSSNQQNMTVSSFKFPRSKNPKEGTHWLWLEPIIDDQRDRIPWVWAHSWPNLLHRWVYISLATPTRRTRVRIIPKRRECYSQK